MTKAEFIGQVAVSAGMSKKDTEAVVEAMFAAVSQQVRVGKRFAYSGFGTFKVQERAARKGRNPRTGTGDRCQGKPDGEFQAGAGTEG